MIINALYLNWSIIHLTLSGNRTHFPCHVHHKVITHVKLKSLELVIFYKLAWSWIEPRFFNLLFKKRQYIWPAALSLTKWCQGYGHHEVIGFAPNSILHHWIIEYKGTIITHKLSPHSIATSSTKHLHLVCQPAWSVLAATYKCILTSRVELKYKESTCNAFYVTYEKCKMCKWD